MRGSWGDFRYYIASKPFDPAVDQLGGTDLSSRIIMSTYGVWIALDPNDALLVKLAIDGIYPTTDPDFYIFTGDRDELDGWLAANYPNISYIWIDCCFMSFANRAAKAELDQHLGSRLFDEVPIP